MNIANKLSILRILLVPLLVVVFMFLPNPQNYFIALFIFVIGTLTDLMDGYIARKRNLITTFGKFIDPVADKVLVNTALVLLLVNGDIPFMAFLIMLWRDLLVDGVRMVASSENQVIAASIFGKLKTVLQMTAIILLFLRNWPFSLMAIPMDQIILWLAVLASFLSGVDYLIKSSAIWYRTK